MGAGGVVSAETKTETATFAGGCFWCMDAEFSGIPGVIKVVSGYTGGTLANPTYTQVSFGDTGHFESIEVTFDPEKVTYAKLLDIFWHNIDPTDKYGQFCDKGTQYRAGIFTHGDGQQKLAEASRDQVKKLFDGHEVATLIRPAMAFYPAEDYHQDYYRKNTLHYKLYHMGCGRDGRLHELWNGKPETVTPK
jgi:peptide-methionine (S)-S-oxide reductase